MQRAFTVEIALYLIELAVARTRFTGRSRNKELCHLVALGLAEVEKTGREGSLKNNTHYARTTLYIDEQLFDTVAARAKINNRSNGKELNVLVALALSRIAERDMSIIRRAAAAGQESHEHSEIEARASQPEKSV